MAQDGWSSGWQPVGPAVEAELGAPPGCTEDQERRLLEFSLSPLLPTAPCAGRGPHTQGLPPFAQSRGSLTPKALPPVCLSEQELQWLAQQVGAPPSWVLPPPTSRA